MAKQDGLLQLHGTIENLTFFKTKNGPGKKKKHDDRCTNSDRPGVRKNTGEQ